MSQETKKALADIKQDMQKVKRDADRDAKLFEQSDKGLSEKLKKVSQSADEVEKHIEQRSE